METSAFQSFELAVMAATGLSKDALHVYVGLTVWLVTVATLRRSVGSLLPLGVVLAVAIVAEGRDVRDDIVTHGHWRIGASAHDVVNTMFWPTILRLLARVTRIAPRRG
jgi:hypothetical protein